MNAKDRGPHYLTSKDYSPVELRTNAGLIFIVSKCDLESISRYRWNVAGRGYVLSAYIDFKTKKKVPLKLHRYILSYTGKMDIDHIDGNKLNNQRSNLRIVPRTVNNLNRLKRRKDGLMVGVTKHGNGFSAKVGITINGKTTIKRKYFTHLIDAESFAIDAKKKLLEEYNKAHG